MYKVSFTGYRPDKLPFFGEDDPLCIELKKRLRNEIEKTVEDGARDFYTGMALGIDTWAAEIVLELKNTRPDITLTALIPCPEQSDNWPDADKERYSGILKQCEKAITISDHFTKGCMYKRNKALVEICDLLIAVYDGQRGGTQQTIGYAKKVGKRIVVIPPI